MSVMKTAFVDLKAGLLKVNNVFIYILYLLLWSKCLVINAEGLLL